MKLTMLFAIIALLLISCGDDDTSPKDNNNNNVKDDLTNRNIFTKTIGDWWLFENYAIDEQGIRKGASTVDTVKLIAEVQKDGQSALEFQIKDVSGNETGRRYYYESGNEIYIHKDFINQAIAQYGGEGLELPFEIKQNWIKIVDKVITEWDSYSEQVGEIVLSSVITIKGGTLTLKGKRGDDKDIEFNGKKIRCHEFILEFKFVGLLNTDPVERTFKFAIKNWLGDDSGIVLTTYDSGTFEIGLPDPVILPGRESKALEINTKK